MFTQYFDVSRKREKKTIYTSYIAVIAECCISSWNRFHPISRPRAYFVSDIISILGKTAKNLCIGFTLLEIATAIPVSGNIQYTCSHIYPIFVIRYPLDSQKIRLEKIGRHMRSFPISRDLIFSGEKKSRARFTYPTCVPRSTLLRSQRKSHASEMVIKIQERAFKIGFDQIALSALSNATCR